MPEQNFTFINIALSNVRCRLILWTILFTRVNLVNLFTSQVLYRIIDVCLSTVTYTRITGGVTYCIETFNYSKYAVLTYCAAKCRIKLKGLKDEASDIIL